MSFAEVYSDLLLPFVESYKEANNEKNRTLVVKNAADAVLNSRNLLEEGVDLPKDLKTVRLYSFRILLHGYSLVQAIARYIKGFIKKETTAEKETAAEGGVPKPTKLKQFYNVRDVIKDSEKYKAMIKDEIPYKPSDKEYIGSYQRAVTTVLESLSGKELQEAQNIADLWNKQGAPPEVQLK
jgi:hypothetical protein